MTSLNLAESSFSKSHIGRIPVKNIWLLMLYASELQNLPGKQKINFEENPDKIPDLVAEVLANIVEKRLHKNLSFGYVMKSAELSRVRGRINFLNTERHKLLLRGKVACDFEALTIDTARNRYVLCALEKVSKLVDSQSLAHKCRSLAGVMKGYGVSSNKPTDAELSKDRFGRHDSEDRVMIGVAKLAFNLLLPNESDGNILFDNPNKDEVWVRRLFEKAIAGFYKLTLPINEWHVITGKTLKWPIERESEGLNAILPSMKTDIILDEISSDKRILIDTKFTSIFTRGWYRDESLKSNYLYQIYAYLMTQVNSGNQRDKFASGVLLHPSVGQMIKETVCIQDHSITFATVDLTEHPTIIKKQLMEIVYQTYL